MTRSFVCHDCEEAFPYHPYGPGPWDGMFDRTLRYWVCPACSDRLRPTHWCPTLRKAVLVRGELVVYRFRGDAMAAFPRSEAPTRLGRADHTLVPLYGPPLASQGSEVRRPPPPHWRDVAEVFAGRRSPATAGLQFDLYDHGTCLVRRVDIDTGHASVPVVAGGDAMRLFRPIGAPSPVDGLLAHLWELSRPHARDRRRAAHVVFGPPIPGEQRLAEADVVLHGSTEHAWVGRSVAGAGDVDADGFDDLLIGANGDSSGNDHSGSVYLLRGPIAPGVHYLEQVADVKFESTRSHHAAGAAVAGAGDVDGDGFDDILIGAPSGFIPGHLRPGDAYLFYGGPHLFGEFDLRSGHGLFD